MEKYRCKSCDREFDEPRELHTTYEKWWGCDIPSHTPLVVHLCPYCNAEEIDEIEEEYECDE